MWGRVCGWQLPQNGGAADIRWCFPLLLAESMEARKQPRERCTKESAAITDRNVPFCVHGFESESETYHSSCHGCQPTGEGSCAATVIKGRWVIR